ncbi:MAG: DUF1501 domain-containing protein [Pirellulaceae bacterium]|nr:DUF1501 domain-containing protein [Pirellulaceae bacterium]
MTCNFIQPLTTRRAALRTVSLGFGWLAFQNLVAQSLAAADAPPKPEPHFPPTAKRVIFLCMRGAPSHVDTFDYKPKLQRDSGQPGRRPGTKLLGSPWKFAQHGQSGQWISELFPEVAQHADQLCMLKSLHTDLPAHPQAFLRLHTGTSQFVRPSLGAWSLYGLGSENENLPGFVTITPPNGFGGAQNYGSGFLPAVNQATRIGSDNRPVSTATLPYLQPRAQRAQQQADLALIDSFNRAQQAQHPDDEAIEGVIESYELAFKMQSELPGVLNLQSESAATQKLYGIGDRTTDDFGRKCLMARRLIEAGVRFVEITHGNWDQHFNLQQALQNNCDSVDKPIAGLLSDLQSRGLLKDTLVVWSGEFGRTPHAQGDDGRDHNNAAFTSWMAGGGVKGGYAHGSSDEYGYEAVDNPMSIHDLHATVLHLLGIDHKRLTYRYAGRDFRLTDVYGNVAKEILA